MNLEQALEHAAEHLPDGWQIKIEVEKGAGWVTAIRPDETEVGMSDAEDDFSDQVVNAIRLAHDELAADKLCQANA